MSEAQVCEATFCTHQRILLVLIEAPLVVACDACCVSPCTHSLLCCVARIIPHARMSPSDSTDNPWLHTLRPQEVVQLRARQRAIDCWRLAMKRVRWYLHLRKLWSALGQHLNIMKAHLGPVSNPILDKRLAQIRGRSKAAKGRRSVGQ